MDFHSGLSVIKILSFRFDRKKFLMISDIKNNLLFILTNVVIIFKRFIFVTWCSNVIRAAHEQGPLFYLFLGQLIALSTIACASAINCCK